CSLSHYRAPRHLHSFPTRRSSDLSILPSALDSLKHKHPDLRLEIKQLDIENAMPALSKGTVDLILGEDYPGVMPLTDNTVDREQDRKSTRLNSSHVSISYAVFCLK